MTPGSKKVAPSPGRSKAPAKKTKAKSAQKKSKGKKAAPAPRTRALTPPEKAALRRKPPAKERARAERIYEILGEVHPDAHCELDFETPFQLGVATILSAQCTDKRVNMVTPALFRAFPNAEAMALATQEEVEELVRTTGFFRNKAKNIRGFSQQIVENHGGVVPQDMESLLKLPGVARKTANCILSNAYNLAEGVVVDTHVLRLGNLLRLTRTRNVAKVEEDLCWRFPRETWALLSHRLIWHGRRTCIARRPRCGECELRTLCPGAEV